METKDSIKEKITTEIKRLYGANGYEGLDNWGSVRNTKIFQQDNYQDLYEGLQASRGLSLNASKSTEDNINHIKNEIEKGLPIEIYVFTNITDWIDYEGIQADIFDHLLSVIPEFGLRIFQNPTGKDFKKIVS